LIGDKIEEEKSGAEATESEASHAQSAQARAAPTSWANLFARPSAAGHAASSVVNGAVAGEATVNGGSTDAINGNHLPASAASKANALAEVIRAYQVPKDKISFLEPRGLINTGNMCYLNSVSLLLMLGPILLY
jgi:ubiquitin carboxyl-terminal hydrolase 10